MFRRQPSLDRLAKEAAQTRQEMLQRSSAFFDLVIEKLVTDEIIPEDTATPATYDRTRWTNQFLVGERTLLAYWRSQPADREGNRRNLERLAIHVTYPDGTAIALGRRGAAELLLLAHDAEAVTVDQRARFADNQTSYLGAPCTYRYGDAVARSSGLIYVAAPIAYFDSNSQGRIFNQLVAPLPPKLPETTDVETSVTPEVISLATH